MALEEINNSEHEMKDSYSVHINKKIKVENSEGKVKFKKVIPKGLQELLALHLVDFPQQTLLPFQHFRYNWAK